MHSKLSTRSSQSASRPDALSVAPGAAAPGEQSASRPARGEALRLLLLVCTLLAALWLSARGLTPPAAQPRSAPLSEVAAQRAAETLDLILGDGTPHPVGSERNQRVRDRVVGELKRLGYAPQLQHALSCQPGVCAEVDNIWLRIPGSDPQLKSLLLVAHYDSVPAAPGAGDDGLGVASLLELARALKHRPALRRSSLLLFSDGEEAGLLGMRAFTEHAAFADVGLCVNIESRGNAGPSLLFETAPGDADLVRRFAATAKHPVTSSVFQAVYERLPNDTDFSVAKQHGLSGFNFATIAGIERYHTAEDNLENLSRQSLQHSLDNLLAAVNALAGESASDERPSLARSSAATQSYFDVLGQRVVFLPRWAGSAALIAACMILLFIAAWQSNSLNWRRLGAAILAVVGGLLGSCAVALLLGWGLRATGRLPDLWVAHPRSILCACAGVSASALLLLSRSGKGREPLLLSRSGKGREPLLLSRSGKGQEPPRNVMSLEHGIVVGLFFCGLGLALQGQLPGASYLGFIPALGVSLSCLAAAIQGRFAANRSSIAWLVWSWGCALSFCTVILWLPILLQLYAAIGLLSLAIYSALWFVLGLTLLPLLAGKHTHGARWAMTATLCAYLLALLQPAYNKDVPQRASVGVTYDVDARSTQIWVDVSHGPAPSGLATAFDLSATPQPSFPWLGGWRDASVVGTTNTWKARPRSSLIVARRSQSDAGTLLSLNWKREVWTQAVSLSLPATQPARVNFVSGAQREDDVPPYAVISAPTPGASLNQHWKRWIYIGSSRQPLRVELLLPGETTRDSQPGAVAGALKVLVCEHRFELPDPIKKLVLEERSDAATAAQHGDNTAICRTEAL